MATDSNEELDKILKKIAKSDSEPIVERDPEFLKSVLAEWDIEPVEADFEFPELLLEEWDIEPITEWDTESLKSVLEELERVDFEPLDIGIDLELLESIFAEVN
jgi:hypothetical protein